MKFISKKPIGSLNTYFKMSKSNTLKTYIVVLCSVLMFSAVPFFSGSGLPSADPMGPYLNNTFPEVVDNDLDATYRVAFPNITFFYPITFNTVPTRNKVVVGQLNGIIYWFDNDETTSAKNMLLDLSADVGLVSDGGFLGMTMHPDFDAAVNPKNYFYAYYATKNAMGQDSPGFGQYTSQGCSYGESEYQGNHLILERFEVDPSTMTFVANSRTIILKHRMYGTTHYGGGLTFGDDGFLYLTTGDQASWQRSQDIVNNLSGGVLRIDVDKDPTKSHPPVRTKPADTGFPGEITGVEYWIPNDNPFSDTTPGSTTNIYGQLNLTTPNPNDVWQSGDFFEEYYAIGLRNPFRMTKDSQTGTMYIGDVGLNSREEINILASGANFGWPVYEGEIFRQSCYSDLFNQMAHEEPLLGLTHDIANSITGGYVYRGSAIPELSGRYICADYGGGNEIFSVDINTGDFNQVAALTEPGVAGVIAFGEDDDGELFMLGLGQNTTLFKLIDDDIGAGPLPQLLSQTGIFSDLTTLDVNDGFVPYELYESFWSDGALKKRWIAVPNNDGVHNGADEQVKYSEYGDWEFPEGTVIVKHFDLRVDDNNPSVTKKIETRVSVVGSDGKMYFLTYNWNDNETDAVLQSTSLDEPVDIATTSGGTRTQTWHFPSNSDCINCHNDANKGGLGLKSRYLNTDYTYAETGITANQLVTLSHLGIIDETITDNDTNAIITNKALDDTNASLDEKARSYLDLNCAYCHRHDNDNRAEFDLRYYNSLEATELLTAGILSPLNIDPNEEIVFAGDASKSILFHRMNSVDVNIMMPPISKTIIDQPAVDLVEQWINQLDSNSTNVPNDPNPYVNLALLTSAQLTAYSGPGQNRGTPLDILYDPSVGNYKIITQFAEYGVPYSGAGSNLGTVDADNGFFWRVDWPNPKFLNYITFGGAYPNQRQEFTMWRISYLRNGTWHTIEEGQGGWIDNDTGDNFTTSSIYEWDGTNQPPVYAEAVRLQLFSDGVHDLFRIHLRGRGGETQFTGGSDLGAEPKASMLQFLGYDTKTTIDNIVAGTQTSCDLADDTYTQELVVTYTNPPATGSLVVNGQSFPITASPQTITLTGLDSDGMDVEVNADFTDGHNSSYKSNGTVFTAPVSCRNIIVGIDEIMVLNGDHHVGSTESIEVHEGGSLTINGNLTIDGDVTLFSTSTKFSSLIINGTSTGNIKYMRHVNAFNGTSGNDLIASPLKGQTFGNFATENPNLFENPGNTTQKLFGPFDEASGTYEIYSTSTDGTVVLLEGKGYRAARDSSEDGTYGTTLTFEGEAETASVPITITQSSSSFDGWNLIGNPYPSYIDFDAFFALNKTVLDVGSYQAIYGYDGDTSDGWTILNDNTTGNLIAPGQGFFVKSKTGGGTITFTPAMRVPGNTDDFIQGRSSAHQGYVKILANSSNSNFTTDIYFNDNATLGLDPGYDAALFNGNPPNFALYSRLVENDVGVPYAIQTLSGNALNNITIPLGVHASHGQTVNIAIDETDLPSSINVYLEDRLNNSFTLLNTSDYNFTASGDVTGSGRFFLRFENQALSISEPVLNDLIIYTDQQEKNIVIKGNLENQAEYKLYGINGKIIMFNELSSMSNIQKIDVSQLSAGIYILELQNGLDQKRIEKLIIK